MHFNEKNGEVEEVKQKLLNEAISVKEKFYGKIQSQRLLEQTERKHVMLPRKIESPTWVNLGENILHLVEYMTSQESAIVSIFYPNLIPLQSMTLLNSFTDFTVMAVHIVFQTNPIQCNSKNEYVLKKCKL